MKTLSISSSTSAPAGAAGALEAVPPLLGEYNLYYLGYAYLNTGEYARARQRLERCLVRRPDDFEVKRALAWLNRQSSPPSTGQSPIE